MTAVSNGLDTRGGPVQEPVYTNSSPAKKLASTTLPSTDSTEDRMMSLLGRKKAIKELQNTKLIIRRLPQNITITELTQFLDPIPDHSYLYLARGDSEFSREDSLFARAYINLTSQEDAFSFCKKLDGFPLKSAGRLYRPVFEYAPFHRVPKRASVKTDSKEGTIETDPDYLAFIQSLHESKSPVEDKVEPEKRTDTSQTTPLIQHLIQKHKYSNNRGGARSSSYSEPKVIKKRNTTVVKETDYTAIKERKTFRGPSAQSRSKVISDTPQKPNPKAGSVIIVTDKSTSIKKGSGQLTDDKTVIVHDNYSKGVSSEYSSRSYKSSPSYYQSDRGGYSRRGGGNKKRGRGSKYSSDYNGHQYYKDWEYDDRGGYDRKGRYDNWYEGDSGSARGRSDRGRSFDYDSQHYHTPRGGRQY
ncbi:Regulator of nonsense transcripts 3A [Oopsacas minuta]|uniref:Regulator of nonsense transcripts 3A n=1 Tax=Oopsacas minuta TaxID=111878 RepID=A0AAV7JUP3_9METZ|nr:Regulator of nonsense transcripts 3A [Oopsacas minuta]